MVAVQVLVGIAVLAGLGGCDGKRRPGPRPEGARPQRVEPSRPAQAELGAGGGGGRAAAPAGDGGVSSVPGDDPRQGKFGLEDALEGLGGKGALLATMDLGKFGKLTCELYEEAAPNVVANFVGLARGLRPFKDPETKTWGARPFYDGLTCHKVIPQFVVHCGDPLGKGTGDPGYLLPAEVTPDLAFDRPGRLAMASRAGTDPRFGSQFFVTERPAQYLNGRFAIFGQCQPVALVEKLTRLVVDSPMNNRPVEPVVIRKVTISRGRPVRGR